MKKEIEKKGKCCVVGFVVVENDEKPFCR